VTRPDLSDDAKVAQYRAELRAVGRNQRLTGFALVILGAIAVWAAGYAGGAGPAVQWAGYAALAFGWALMLAAIFLRTRYHRRRMREEG
jgi:membrane protein YdbS with pleckstrin-like domain